MSNLINDIFDQFKEMIIYNWMIQQILEFVE